MRGVTRLLLASKIRHFSPLNHPTNCGLIREQFIRYHHAINPTTGRQIQSPFVARGFKQIDSRTSCASRLRTLRMSSTNGAPNANGLGSTAAVAAPNVTTDTAAGLSEVLTGKPALNDVSPVSKPLPLVDVTYPKARKDESVVETLHGVTVADPYRWLEEPDSEETRKFVDEQNRISSQYIQSCADREAIRARLTELWDYPKYTCTSKRGSHYLYRYNTGLQNQSVLYKQKSLDATPEVLLDPNELSTDGTVSISFTSFSEDGKYMAYGLSQSGSDWIDIKVKEVESGRDLSDVLRRAKFTNASWTHDGLGFFYSRYPDAAENGEGGAKQDGTETTQNKFHRIYYHRLNTPQSEDILAVHFPTEPKWMAGIEVSDCGKRAFVFVKEGCQNERVFYTSLEGGVKADLPLTPLVNEFTDEYSFVASDDQWVYLLTNRKAPLYRLIKMDINNPEEANWVEIIPQHEKDVLECVVCVNSNQIMCHWMRDVASALERRSLTNGTLIQAYTGLPIGTVDSISGRRIQSEVFMSLSSFLNPSVMYYQDLAKEPAPGATDPELKLVRQVKLNKFDSSQFVTKQIFYTSKDGTRVPMFIVHHKDVKQDGNNVTQLWGYGGFNISVQPFFSPVRLLLLGNFRGVYALANIRGGGEYGESWHSGGTFHNKQNVFDDFIAAGEYLIGEGYTRRERLYIEGGSNGGLLVGACCNQRPDLFGAAVAQVGVMDMLRFHKFTIGHAWCTDYGNPDEESHFKNVLKYSPLHNVPDELPAGVNYPALLLTTADHDDRVVPLHSLKFIATVHEKLGDKNGTVPLIIKVDTKAGHGAGKPTAKIIEERTDVYAFIANALGAKFRAEY